LGFDADLDTLVFSSYLEGGMASRRLGNFLFLCWILSRFGFILVDFRDFGLDIVESGNEKNSGNIHYERIKCDNVGKVRF